MPVRGGCKILKGDFVKVFSTSFTGGGIKDASSKNGILSALVCVKANLSPEPEACDGLASFSDFLVCPLLSSLSDFEALIVDLSVFSCFKMARVSGRDFRLDDPLTF